MTDENVKTTKKKRTLPAGMIPLNQRTPEERRAIQSKGGKASQKKIRERKTFNEIINAILELPIDSGDIVTDFSSLKSMSKKNMDVKTALALAQVKSALRGNINSFNILAQLIGDLKEDNPQLDKLDELLQAVKQESEDSK